MTILTRRAFVAVLASAAISGSFFTVTLPRKGEMWATDACHRHWPNTAPMQWERDAYPNDCPGYPGTCTFEEMVLCGCLKRIA